MKNYLLITCLSIFFALPLMAQPIVEDSKTVDNLIAALYAVISGEAEDPRNWERFRNLFTTDAKLMPTTKDKEGKISYRVISPAEYETVFIQMKRSFYETELKRETLEYGAIAHVWSTYATRYEKSGPTVNRGINSIQLLYANDRYYIMNITWCAENMGYPLPADFLPKQ